MDTLYPLKNNFLLSPCQPLANTMLLSVSMILTTLGTFHTLATVNNSTTNTGVQISLQDPAFNLFGIYPEVGLLGHMVIIFLISWGTTYCFSQQLYHFTVLPTMHWVPIFPHPAKTSFPPPPFPPSASFPFPPLPFSLSLFLSLTLFLSSLSLSFFHSPHPNGTEVYLTVVLICWLGSYLPTTEATSANLRIY